MDLPNLSDIWNRLGGKNRSPKNFGPKWPGPSARQVSRALGYKSPRLMGWFDPILYVNPYFWFLLYFLYISETWRTHYVTFYSYYLFTTGNLTPRLTTANHLLCWDFLGWNNLLFFAVEVNWELRCDFFFWSNINIEHVWCPNFAIIS